MVQKQGPWLSAENRRIVVVGPAGTGKTTALQIMRAASPLAPLARGDLLAHLRKQGRCGERLLLLDDLRRSDWLDPVLVEAWGMARHCRLTIVIAVRHRRDLTPFARMSASAFLCMTPY